MGLREEIMALAKKVGVSTEVLTKKRENAIDDIQKMNKEIARLEELKKKRDVEIEAVKKADEELKNRKIALTTMFYRDIKNLQAKHPFTLPMNFGSLPPKLMVQSLNNAGATQVQEIFNEVKKFENAMRDLNNQVSKKY